MLTLMRTGGFAPLLRAPDDGDGDGGMNDADARAMRALKDKLEQRAPKDDDGEDDEDDFEVQVGPPPSEPRDDDEPPPSRTERRRERLTEIERLRAENERLRAAQPAAPPVYQQPVAPAQQLPSMDQIRETLDAEFARIQNEELELERTVSAHVTAKTMTPETLESLKAKQRQLLKDKAIAQHRWAEMEDGTIMRRFQPQQPQVDPATAALNAEYADVAQDPRAAQHASAYYMREVARIQMGERDAIPPYALRREAWQAGRNLLEGKHPGNGARRPAPTQERKAKYTGMSTNNAGGSGAPARAKDVFITPQEDTMAQERFKHLKTPEARRKAFVKMKAERARQRERAQ